MPIIWIESSPGSIREDREIPMADAAVKIANARRRSGAGADGRLPSRHRCAQAQRHQDDLRRARHSDHGFRPHGAGLGHPRTVVPPRAECRLCRGDRGLPDQEAGRLPHRVGARLPQRPHRARACHHQLLSDDPDLRLVGTRDRRSCSRATTRRWTSSPSPSRCARRRSACCTPPTSASGWRARSAPRSPGARAASISICRPSCSAR